LQYGRVLTFAQICEQHGFSVGELKGIMETLEIETSSTMG
jgi:hypothetical protein